MNFVDRTDEIVTYINLVDKLNSRGDNGRELWTYDKVLGHRSGIGNRTGLADLEIEWNTGDVTWEPLEVLRKDDPVLIASYVRSSNLMQDSEWKWAHHLTKNAEKLEIMHRMTMNATKAHGRKVKYGMEVPKSIKQALAFDIKNGNNKWQEVFDKEKQQVVDDFETFKVLPRGEKAPHGYDFIPMHWVFDVKVDGTQKARLVAGGNWTAPVEDIYSGVASNDAIRLAFVAASLMRLNVIAADVGNAY